MCTSDSIKAKISKLLRMQQSDNPGEAANAAAFVEKLCKEHGISPVSCLTVSEHGPRRDLTQLVANKFYRVSMAQHVFVKLPFRDGILVLVFDNAT